MAHVVNVPGVAELTGSGEGRLVFCALRERHCRDFPMDVERNSTKRVGFWAAVLTAALSLAYVAGQLAEWTGLLGSGGGPDNPSTAFGLAVLLTPSFLLGPAFLTMIVALHCAAPSHRRVYTHCAVAFAVMYATLNCSIYFVQLTFVAPRLARGDVEAIHLLLFLPHRSFMFAIDLLGYSWMSASTLFAAVGLPVSRVSNATRIALVANGLLIPALALQMYYPWLIWAGSLWAVTFPAAAILTACLFATMSSTAGGDYPVA